MRLNLACQFRKRAGTVGLGGSRIRRETKKSDAKTKTPVRFYIAQGLGWVVRAILQPEIEFFHHQVVQTVAMGCISFF